MLLPFLWRMVGVDCLSHSCYEPQVDFTSITPQPHRKLGFLFSSDRKPSMYVLQHISCFLWSVVGCIFLSNMIRILIWVRMLSIYQGSPRLGPHLCQ